MIIRILAGTDVSSLQRAMIRFRTARIGDVGDVMGQIYNLPLQYSRRIPKIGIPVVSTDVC